MRSFRAFSSPVDDLVHALLHDYNRFPLHSHGAADRRPDFDARVEYVPSLREARSLVVEGDWTFSDPVTVVGDAHLADPGEPRTVDVEVLGEA